MNSELFCPNDFELFSIDKHRCRSGECIEPEKVCDGTFDCYDSSDEEESLCLKSFCPKYAFRCRYGACLPRTVCCNGVEDCVDGSDEDERLCGSHHHEVSQVDANSTGGILPGSCKLPTNRKDLKFISAIFQEEYLAGSYVFDGEFIEVICNRGLAMNVTGIFDYSNSCRDSKWARKWSVFPECQSKAFKLSMGF